MADNRYKPEELNGIEVLTEHYKQMAKIYTNLAEITGLIVEWQQSTQFADYNYSQSDEIYLNSLKMQWTSLKLKIDETNQRAIEMGFAKVLFGLEQF